MKKAICLLLAALLLTAAAACRREESSSPASTAQPAPAETQDAETAAEDLYADKPASTASDASAPVEQSERQDGERFEAVIVMEGMEETVRYEHIRNEMLGFEMDYDYESFVRQSEAVCERFVSIYDDPEDPENYLEVICSAEDADTVAASVIASLSDEYDIIRDSYTLDRAGSCIRIEASELKGTGRMADQLEMVYIIPAADGCRIAMAYCSIEGAEGFGRRFSYMMNTLEVIGRDAESADYGEQPAGDPGQWTGEDFGEQPGYEYEWTGEDFGEQPGYEYEWTGEDFGEQPGYEYEWTGEDFGEQPGYDYGG